MFRVPYFAPCSYRLCKATHICEDFVQALKLFEKSSHCLQLAHTSKQAWLLKQCSLVGAAHVAHCAKAVYGTRVAHLPTRLPISSWLRRTVRARHVLPHNTGFAKHAQVECPQCLVYTLGQQSHSCLQRMLHIRICANAGVLCGCSSLPGRSRRFAIGTAFMPLSLPFCSSSRIACAKRHEITRAQWLFAPFSRRLCIQCSC